MTLINLKFSDEMKNATLEGRKVHTIRDEKKGDVGDVFVIGGRVYRLIRVAQYDINDVGEFYDIEGFSTIDKFESYLKSIYPELTIGSIVWGHMYAYVGDSKKPEVEE
jgi:hypothetical protein